MAGHCPLGDMPASLGRGGCGRERRQAAGVVVVVGQWLMVGTRWAMTHD